MKKIPFIMCLLLLNSACSSKTIVVNDIWDDIPEIAYGSRDLDFEEFKDLDTTLNSWGIGKLRDEKNQPVNCVDANEKYQQFDAVYVEEATNEVYFTFDSGYEIGNTAVILDVLKKQEVSALFFLTAPYVLKNQELVQRMIDEGHVIGNHSYHHPSFPSLNDEELVAEIMDFDDLMLAMFQYKMIYARPPRGEFSEKSLAITEALGYTTLFWSFGYYDFDIKNQPESAASLEKCLNGAHPGAIYLFHTVSDTNVQIMDDLINGLRELNYKIGDFNEFN